MFLQLIFLPEGYVTITTVNEQIQINGHLQNPHTPYTIVALE